MLSSVAWKKSQINEIKILLRFEEIQKSKNKVEPPNTDNGLRTDNKYIVEKFQFKPRNRAKEQE